MDTVRDRAISIIKRLPSDISLKEIIEQLKFIDDEENISISAEAANDPDLKKMIAESRAAYQAKEFSTTKQFLELISNRFGNE